MKTHLQTTPLPPNLDVYAPDGSEIRLLAAASRGSMVHCSLPARGVSKAVKHRTVEELWYFLSGRGKVWRKFGEEDEVTDVSAGISLNIPTGTIFQFRNVGDEPLCSVIVTMPPWPGEEEAIQQKGKWD